MTSFKQALKSALLFLLGAVCAFLCIAGTAMNVISSLELIAGSFGAGYLILAALKPWLAPMLTRRYTSTAAQSLTREEV